MTKAYLEHEKTGKRFEVLGLNREAGTVKLKGEFATFEEPFDKERLKKMGYSLVKGEPTDAEQRRVRS